MENWSTKLRFIEIIGMVGAKITMFLCPLSWWSHSIFMLLLLLGPTVNILASHEPPEYLVSSLFEKLSIVLLASAWGENGVWSKIWCTFVVFVIVLLKYVYESMKVHGNASSGLETEKAEMVDENKKELEVEEAESMETKEEEDELEVEEDESMETKEEELEVEEDESMETKEEELEAEEDESMETKEEELEVEEDESMEKKEEELEVEEAESMETKEEEVKTEEKSKTLEKTEENEGKYEEFDMYELVDKHFTIFAEGIAKPIIERAEAELNHSEFYKREFENTREKLEEKEIQVKKIEEELEQTKRQFEKLEAQFEDKSTKQREKIKKLTGEVSDIAADLYVEVKESEYYRDLLEEKIEDHEFKLEFSYQQEINDLVQKLHEHYAICQHYFNFMQFHRENNGILLKENSELYSKVYALNEFEDKIAGLGSQITDLSDKLYIASSTPQLFQNISD